MIASAVRGLLRSNLLPQIECLDTPSRMIGGVHFGLLFSGFLFSSSLGFGGLPSA